MQREKGILYYIRNHTLQKKKTLQWG